MAAELTTGRRAYDQYVVRHLARRTALGRVDAEGGVVGRDAAEIGVG
jgi:hypothetical protein